MTNQIFRQTLPGAILVAESSQQDRSTELSEEDINQIVQQTQQGLDISTEEDRPYSPDDITTVESTKETRKTYSQNLTAELSFVARQQPGDELQLFAQAVKNRNPNQKYRQMQEIARLYDEMSQNLLDIPIPENFADQHIRLVNNFHLVGLSIEEMTQIEEDPARSLAAIQRYRDIIQSNGDILNQIGQRLNQDLDY